MPPKSRNKGGAKRKPPVITPAIIAARNRTGGGGSNNTHSNGVSKREEFYSSSEESCSPDSRDVSESEDEGSDGYHKGGYHAVHVGDKFAEGRYEVLQKLGWGHFSTVWLVSDSDTGQLAALKVQKSAEHYTEAARDEIDMLASVAEKSHTNPAGAAACVRLLDSFEHRGANGRHVCMVFEVLGDNLLSLIKMYDHKGIPLAIVKLLTRQVLTGLAYLHDNCRIIHTDIKPENVMLSHSLIGRVLPLSSTPPQQQQQQQQQQPVELLATGEGLTKNQKKKAKRKAKRTTGWDNPAAGSGPELQGSAEEDVPESSSHESAPETQQQQPCTTADDNDIIAAVERNADAEHHCRTAESSAGPSSTTAGGDDASADDAAAVASAGHQSAGPTANGAAGAPPTAQSEQQHQQQQSAENGTRQLPQPPPAGLPPARRTLRGYELDDEEWAEIGQRLHSADAKLVDFGNGCWVDRHFTDDIQTRQYRSPEVILGAGYGPAADMWSAACLVFELATGDLLFEPRSHADYDKDEDHLALMQELLGRMPRRISGTGRRARRFFTRAGDLRHIRSLRFWPLPEVLEEKYGLDAREACQLSDFMMPMLDFTPSARATAAEALRHPWLVENMSKTSLPGGPPKPGQLNDKSHVQDQPSRQGATVSEAVASISTANPGNSSRPTPDHNKSEQRSPSPLRRCASLTAL